jgi:hypothetical protein
LTARYHVGDVFEVLATLEDGSVDLVLTSPPFLALRSYLPADHPDKGKEIGSEPTPAAFIDTLLDLTEEWARVLAPHGSLCVELGDTYSGSGGAGGDYNEDGLRDGQPAYKGSAARKENRVVLADGRTIQSAGISNGQERKGEGWPLAKSLCLIPELYRVALVYGFNPLTGRTTPPWRARNVVRWCRPNPSPGALGDKVRPATSDMVVACKSAKRWFDLDAVRTPAQVQIGREVDGNNVKGSDGGSFRFDKRVDSNPAGAPPLDHWWHDQLPQDAWLIPTEPYKGSHYATWPSDLLTKPIEAMCPRRVCRECGKPSERIVGYSDEYAAHRLRSSEAGTDLRERRNTEGHRVTGRGSERMDAEHTTLGWSDCGHDNYRPGLVLDPFAGSGTTLAVATGHGRDAIGIDLDARNADLARERNGMFLDIEHGPLSDREYWAQQVAALKNVPTGDRL